MVGLLLAVIYASFISLGLPDSLLGAAWPSMYQGFSVPVSFSGIIFFIISAGTVVSSLFSDRLTRRLGAGAVTAISVGMTATALFGFSISRSFLSLCLWAIPYGLGAGSVDAALNNYVAIHFASRHMSWLHCMWGVGASTGPYIMGHALAGGEGWPAGYRAIGLVQLALTAVVAASLPLWRKVSISETSHQCDAVQEPSVQSSDSTKAPSLGEIVRIPGAKAIMVSFFCYCAVEQTIGLWASSYMALCKGVPSETAARYAGMFFIGITAGRALSGFLTLRMNDSRMVRLGQSVLGVGIIVFLLPFGEISNVVGLVVMGLGCAPIYPSIIHSTPRLFGEDKSQSVVGVEMASAYVGNCLMPPFFGWISQHISIAVLPYYLMVLLALMVVMHETMLRRTGSR